MKTRTNNKTTTQIKQKRPGIKHKTKEATNTQNKNLYYAMT